MNKQGSPLSDVAKDTLTGSRSPALGRIASRAQEGSSALGPAVCLLGREKLGKWCVCADTCREQRVTGPGQVTTGGFENLKKK